MIIYLRSLMNYPISIRKCSLLNFDLYAKNRLEQIFLLLSFFVLFLESYPQMSPGERKLQDTIEKYKNGGLTVIEVKTGSYNSILKPALNLLCE